LMCRILFHVIVSLLIRVESEDESVAHSILLAHVRSLYRCGARASGTCRPSIEVSFPPVIDKIYGLRVSG
jgi:ferredoxin